MHEKDGSSVQPGAHLGSNSNAASPVMQTKKQAVREPQVWANENSLAYH